MDANKYLELWKKHVTDVALLEEITGITDTNEIANRFSGYLQFGTAGLRGILGAGTRYINKYTILKATLGIINYLKENFKDASVCIAYDNRKYSQKFATLSANLFDNNGIKTYLFNELTPTPVLSFAVRKFKTTLGINITSSHNPKEYNGYKVVNSDGCQISTEQAELITKYIMKANEFDINFDSLEKKSHENITKLDNAITDDFIEISKASLNNYTSKNNLKIIFTPLHGTGFYAIPKILKDMKFEFSYPVQQSKPDENFTTCKNPNPELVEAFSESLIMKESKNADIIIASDPDADRLGVMVKHNGEFIRLTGDELGLIFLNHAINEKKQNRLLSENSFVITTVVSSMLSTKICEKNNICCFRELTGFKNLGERMELEIKKNNPQDFIIAYEESCGYLLTTHHRDKDAITAAAYIAIIADQIKSKNKTLIDYVEDIFKQYGYILNNNVSINYIGIEGANAIIKVIEGLREQEINYIGDFKVEEKIDYLLDNTGLEPSNFLEFKLDKGCNVIIRPSGTEPKLKLYYSSYNPDKEKCKTNMNLLVYSVEEMLKSLR